MSFLKNLFNVTKQEVTEKATELFNIAKQEVTEKATEIIADAKDYAKSFTEEDDEAPSETSDVYDRWRHVFFVDEFPLTTSGKIQKYKLGDIGLELLKKREN